VKILGPRHAVYDYEGRAREKTVIEDGVTLTTGSIILYGVRIGAGAIVGPGSVVNKDVSPGAYVFGVPARDLTRLVSFGKSGAGGGDGKDEQDETE
jgi:acetyltransferase-like isoleucine patch superfamily enzyme